MKPQPDGQLNASITHQSLKAYWISFDAECDRVIQRIAQLDSEATRHWQELWERAKWTA